MGGDGGRLDPLEDDVVGGAVGQRIPHDLSPAAPQALEALEAAGGPGAGDGAEVCLDRFFGHGEKKNTSGWHKVDAHHDGMDDPPRKELPHVL